MTVQALRKAPASFDSARRDAAHFIDGTFTQGSTGKFWENRYAARQQRDRPGARRRQGRDRRRRAAPPRPRSHGPWGRMTVDRAHRHSRQGRRRHQRPLRGVPRRRMPRHRQAVEPRPPPRHSARRRQLQDVRRHRQERLDRELHHADAGRQRARSTTALRRPKGVIAVISPVEPAAAADDLEGRPGARLRQYGRRQAIGGDAADRDAARRGDERRPACRRASTTSSTVWARTRPASS